MNFTADVDREVDGRWIAEIARLPGVMTYGRTRRQAIANARTLAGCVLAVRSNHQTSCPPHIRGKETP